MKNGLNMPDPDFSKESLFGLVELFAPADSDKQTLRKEFYKALEETKERVKNGMDNITLE